ncbi:3-ketoacyl-CoA thiolase [Labilithrix luteola]|uniref:3-ketoacyl-CoA thiolase n=1 Tax=Labilithrix luteola TaxID=1391654 RepID=A0A0K1PSJ6_9BACT|nr:acetyl-CoA C-acyltransferase FadI [Labilithrix luteola]AKU96336.1 3-ketoacyl-CoA thiolase [Labilithrix luteola]
MTESKHSAGMVQPGDRIAIVAGLRTPFAKQGSAFTHLTALDLGRTVVRELLARSEMDPREVGLVVYGQAIPNPTAPNVAREIVLGTTLPKSTDAFTVVRACATSFQTTTSAAEAMLAGQHDVAIAGGADSASDVPVTVTKKLAHVLSLVQRARTMTDKLRALSDLSPRDLVPIPPALREPSTGLTMGEHAERMAQRASVSREEQDRFAHQSHVRASAAWTRGFFDAEVMHIVPPPAFDRPIDRDNMVRADSSLEAYAKLRPVFDPDHGTVTAGNSSPLTDGASALLLMKESKAKALGFAPLGYLRSWGYAALDPKDGLLMGPAYAVPIALDRAKLRLADMDVVDMHEAFAAQVICNRRALASRRFAEEKLGRSAPIGEVDDDRFNVHGGSIALGHPFGATGARMIHTVLRELRRRGGQFGLATACAAGGLGAAVILEVA